ncbi:MAG TPA: DUF2079 domain-containing protein [Glaciihabitans sp.]|nr:DUF2079 domain-containing protein [Glaciihabitans sp.]
MSVRGKVSTKRVRLPTQLRVHLWTRPRLQQWLVPVLVALVVAAVYTVFGVLQWRAFQSPSWDLGIFTQLARQYASFQAPIVPIKGEGFNLLGDHFHPLLVLLGPIYALAPSAFTLVVVQNILFGVSAAVVAVAATTILGRIAGPLVGLVYGFSWGLQGAAAVQFHEIAFAVPLLALSLSAVMNGRWRAAALWAAPIVFVKEDLGLTVLMIGLVIAYRGPKPLGLAVALWGVIWFGIGTLIVLPLLNPNGEWAYTGSMDPLAMLTNPALLLDPQKLSTLWLLILIGGGMALLSPLAAIALPTLAWRFLSSNEGYWGHEWQYSAVLMPIVFLAALEAIRRLRDAPTTRITPAWLHRYSAHAGTVIIVAGTLLIPQFALGRLANPTAEFATDRAASAEGALAVIADDSRVESDIGLMTYLVDRTTVTYIGNPNAVPEYLVVDLYGGGLPAEWPDIQDVAAALHPLQSFRTIYSDGGYQVAVPE